ncbi:MAG: hypothetical protein OXG27_14540 [Chloroflexi bacterium]|nr:hypothetical protein [Chloroflexota bacterium]
MPNHDGEQLHVCKFEHYGRGRISVGDLRSARNPGEFDVVLNGEAHQPHEAFADAHAEVTGPTQRAAGRLRNALRDRGEIEKLPPMHMRSASRSRPQSRRAEDRPSSSAPD